jgi:aspartate/tyrosine/aromatic aminotransferase
MFFQHMQEAPPDPVFGLLEAFRKDPRKDKVNLMVGIVRDNQLRAERYPSILAVQSQFVDTSADYLPIDGFADLPPLIAPILFGEKLWQQCSDRIYGAHTTGGTGALRVLAEFLAQEVSRTIYLPNPTWPNHKLVFERAGCNLEFYPYYSHEKHRFDLEAMLAFLSRCPKGSVILLHACCHNPTGSDPTLDQWQAISQAVKQQGLFPFFDCAYQGLGDGLEADAQAVRLFLEEGHEMAVAYSCSKNFSLYSERVGVAYVITDRAAMKVRAASQVKRVIRALYSNPPSYGARLVCGVLRNLDTRQMWQDDLARVRHRLNEMREMLVEKLKLFHLKEHKGMFSYLDIDKVKVKMLMEEFGIYMTDNGRISIAGLTTKNIDYVAEGLLAVCGKG